MLIKMQQRYFSWMNKAIQQAHTHNNKTVAILVDHSEVKEGGLPFLGGLEKSKEFRQDLNINKTYWFYSSETQKRALLIQQKLKPDASLEDKKKEMRSLGVKACAELQARKSTDVQIIASEKIPHDLLGIFRNSFALTNYEFSKKTSQEKEDEKKDQDEDFDERIKKVSRRIDNVEITTENNSFQETEDYKFWDIAA